ncbi:hypothetical protein GCM10025876_38520 [Demequina litorisediminis]|uniref:Carbohydrate kinase PfkB domain-containing protein n=1 Tax=Demequina litorisediminis TaxID=1849022 RepID=A0ABQ6IKH5_9MICO|nr:hypothetical protein GCM10025876_38520 [Demequina litorisediminis]
MVSRTESCIGLADVVKASDEDIAWLYPDLSLEEVLAHWGRLGAKVCVATLGAEGSLAAIGGETVRVEPIRVDVVDTVGAGDSFMSALIDGMLRSGLLGLDARATLAEASVDQIASTVRRAARAAAITVSRAGANPPHVREARQGGGRVSDRRLRRPRLHYARAMGMQIAPSILSADFANLESEIVKVDTADWLHVDVMDGHFVPNLTLGLPVVERIAEVSPMPIDAHLMIENPDHWAPRYAEAGAASVTFHYEAAKDPRAIARDLRRLGARASVALKPGTPVDVILDDLVEFDMVLVMTVEPGFGGRPSCRT